MTVVAFDKKSRVEKLKKGNDTNNEVSKKDLKTNNNLFLLMKKKTYPR